MFLRDCFEKPVDRPIEGVIKADDAAGLRTEMDEYVLTGEAERQLQDLLEAYAAGGTSNGVWISGFFGSGKSHLLKMLAVLLENRELDGEPALDLFLRKSGLSGFFRAALKKACAIPSQSVLFNIDQKTDIVSKSQVDAVLSVFVKVFNELRGYYGKQGHVARFERDLDSRGLLGRFREEFARVAGIPWERGREQIQLETAHVAEAWAAVTGDNAGNGRNIIAEYRSDYKMSIEDFADEVNAHIEEQERRGRPGFRLNFFVDEVGQYVAGSTKLMTNLQTVAESLHTRCRGRAWIVVTAQEDVDSVVGGMDGIQANDFSKIQARFAGRVKLTSKDVGEVIEKRLLEKNAEGRKELAALHSRVSGDFRTLFEFADGSRAHPIFRDEEHFIRSWPFVPYQFSLFQSAMQELSRHNAFEGRHSSVGERSMLGVFQHAAVAMGDLPMSALAPFDGMFEGIRGVLKSQAQTAILKAEKDLGSPFAVRLLKALLLVKYVREFKSTPRNLRILMLSGFDRSIPELDAEIGEALALLEQQTYIQRNGDIHEFLTNEEKDVEEEIRATEVDNDDLLKVLEGMIFDEIIGDRKIRHAGHDFSFTRMLDDVARGREHSVALNVVTPYNSLAGREEAFLMRSSERPEALVILPQDARLMQDLAMFRRTEKYVQQCAARSLSGNLRAILQARATSNGERRTGIRERLREILAKAPVVILGASVDVAGDARQRMLRVLEECVIRTHPLLDMLKGAAYAEADIAGILHEGAGLVAAPLPEAEDEVRTRVEAGARSGVRVTLKSLLEHFRGRPYGWSQADTLCVVARLCARGRLELRGDGTAIGPDGLEQALRAQAGHAGVTLEPMAEFSPAQVGRLKDAWRSVFDSPPPSDDARGLAEAVAAGLRKMEGEVGRLRADAADLPFAAMLDEVLDALGECSGRDWTWFLTDFPAKADALADMREDPLDAIRAFMKSPGRKIWRDAHDFLRDERSGLAQCDAAARDALEAMLASPDCFRGRGMQRIAEAHEALRRALEEQRTAEREAARRKGAELRGRLEAMPEYGLLDAAGRAKVAEEFAAYDASLEAGGSILEIREAARGFEDSGWTRILGIVTAASSATSGGGGLLPAEGGIRPLADFLAAGERPLLATEAEVDAWIASLREALLGAVRGGGRIRM